MTMGRAKPFFIILTVLGLGSHLLRSSMAEPAPSPITSAASKPSGKAFKPVAEQHLHNAHIITEKIISGAQPDDDAAFKALSDLGVKTILSVDGAQPDLAAAKKYGMRYVHMPIGYDGVSEEQGMAIAKALIELPGPIYVHCHHGKHRSAAAIAVACVYNGQLKPGQAESVLQTFGTGANYKGLWKAARDARPLDSQMLAEMKVEYVETKKIGEIAEAMVVIDRYMDHLKLLQKSGWQVPADHVDLDPAHEALQLQEHLHEVSRLASTAARPAEYRQMLVEGEDAGKSLHTALSAKPPEIQNADTAFKRVSASCVNCHKAYRD